MISDLETLLEKEEVIFLAYLGLITQPIITAIVDSLEKIEEDENIKFSQKLYMAFIEMTQNIMHYSEKGKFKPFVLIGKEGENYYVLGKNLVSAKVKEMLEKNLNEILKLDKQEIRKLYRQKRKSGKDSHNKGAGIGFLEIAKVAKKMEFDFEPFEDKYIFALKVCV